MPLYYTDFFQIVNNNRPKLDKKQAFDLNSSYLLANIS